MNIHQRKLDKEKILDIEYGEDVHEWRQVILNLTEANEPSIDRLRDVLRLVADIRHEEGFERLQKYVEGPQDVGVFPLEPAVVRFKRLSEQWYNESAFMSSPIEMAMLPSYQQIIGMGWPAVPLILEELREEPDHWFWALTAITGDNPVTDDANGDISLMAQTWIEWGKYHGIIE